MDSSSLFVLIERIKFAEGRECSYHVISRQVLAHRPGTSMKVEFRAGELFYDKIVEEAKKCYRCPTNFVSNPFIVKLRLLTELIVFGGAH